MLLKEVVLPKGRFALGGGYFHVAGPYEGGWRAVDVWESEETADAFFAQHTQAFVDALRSSAAFNSSLTQSPAFQSVERPFDVLFPVAPWALALKHQCSRIVGELRKEDS